jgi:hypothetical protein
MNFDETIRLQSLKLKELNTRGSNFADKLIDMALADPAQTSQLPLKNICAMVTQQMFDEVDGLCQLLDISKRSFVEMALRQALDNAASIVNEVQPFPEEHA